MVHVRTQNMESRKNMVQGLAVAGGCNGVGHQSPLPVTRVALVGRIGSRKRRLFIPLEPFRVFIVLNHFEGL